MTYVAYVKLIPLTKTNSTYQLGEAMSCPCPCMGCKRAYKQGRIDELDKAISFLGKMEGTELHLLGERGVVRMLVESLTYMRDEVK